MPSIRTVLFTACALGFSLPAQAAFLFGRVVPDAPALEANDASNEVDVSSDGRTLVFSTLASNWSGCSIQLVPRAEMGAAAAVAALTKRASVMGGPSGTVGGAQ